MADLRDGTTSSGLDVDDRRLRPGVYSVISSARYAGSLICRILNTSVANLKVIRARIICDNKSPLDSLQSANTVTQHR